MAQQQDMYWDEEAQEFVVYEQPKKDYTAIYIVVYFLLLALIVVPAQSLHLGMQGIFFAMIGAGVILGLFILGVKLAKRKIENMHLTRKGFAQLMVGYEPETVQGEEVIAGTSRALVPASSTSVISYDDGAVDGDGPPPQIFEKEGANLAPNFNPTIHSLVPATKFVCGITRSGKSNLIAVLVENMGPTGMPICVFDTEDEYDGLLDPKHLQRMVHAGHENWRNESHAKHCYEALELDEAYDFGRRIVEERLQVVVNLKSYADDDAAVIMVEIVAGINDWQQERDVEYRIPTEIVLDEAHKWLPQNLADSYVTKEHQTLLHQTFFNTVVAQGLKRAIGSTFATQKYSRINKQVMQAQWMFLLKQNEPIDLAGYEKRGLDRNEVLSMLQGEVFIFRLHWPPNIIGFRTRIRERFTKNYSYTPGLGNLTRVNQTQMLEPAVTRRLADMEELQPKRPPRVNKEAELLQRGINAYLEGHTSISKLAAALEINPNQARNLQPKIQMAIEKMEAEDEG